MITLIIITILIIIILIKSTRWTQRYLVRGRGGRVAGAEEQQQAAEVEQPGHLQSVYNCDYYHYYYYHYYYYDDYWLLCHRYLAPWSPDVWGPDSIDAKCRDYTSRDGTRRSFGVFSRHCAFFAREEGSLTTSVLFQTTGTKEVISVCVNEMSAEETSTR